MSPTCVYSGARPRSWRSNRAVLLGWILGLGAYAAVMGALISTMIDWLA